MGRMKPAKHSVAVVVRAGGGRFLAVRRPDDPEDPLAGLWGLPAITLRDGEDEQAAVVRAGRAKLGVQLAAVLIVGAAGTLALRVRGRGIAICLAAVLGGALGNLSDRLFRSPGFGRGAVVDWIHFGGSGSFNVADMAIQFGALAAVVAMIASERAGKVTRAETKA